MNLQAILAVPNGQDPPACVPARSWEVADQTVASIVPPVGVQQGPYQGVFGRAPGRTVIRVSAGGRKDSVVVTVVSR